MGLKIENLTVSYDRHPAIHHIHGEFAKGSLTAIAGPNGGGKSTLLKAIAGLVDIEQGRIRREPEQARLAYLPQATEINREFPILLHDFLAVAAEQKNAFWNALGSDRQEAVERALSAVNLSGFGMRPLQSLSAGQFQRVLFARVLLMNADIILLDEPFSAVDEKTLPLLLQLMQAWHGQGKTILCVLHDVNLIQNLFPQTLLLGRSVIAWGDTPAVMTPENVQRLQGFHEAWREQAGVCAP